LVGRDWLQQLCLVNNDACKKHAKNVYFILFFHFSASAYKQSNKKNKCGKKHLFHIYFLSR